MSWSGNLKVGDLLSAAVRKWLEKVEGRKLPLSYRVWVHAYSTRGSSKLYDEWKDKMAKQERRLKRMAAKMKKAGMGEKDAEIVARGGWGG